MEEEGLRLMTAGLDLMGSQISWLIWGLEQRQIINLAELTTMALTLRAIANGKQEKKMPKTNATHDG
jgi:hypothetical protein